MTQKDLDRIKDALNTQDNRVAQDPLFCVYEKEQICGMDPDYTDLYEWVDNNNSETIGDADDLMQQYALTEEQASRESRFRKCYYVERDRFVSAHFTEAAADHYIMVNGQNLRKPRIYVTSMWRCPEMIALRNALMNGELCVKGD